MPAASLPNPMSDCLACFGRSGQRSTNREVDNDSPSEHAPRSVAKLYAMFVPHNLENWPPFDWDQSQRPWKIPGSLSKFQNRTIAEPPGGNSHIGPKLTDLGNGRVLVLGEERRQGEAQFIATTALVIDETANVILGPKSIPDARLHANNDFFRLPNGRAGWMTGRRSTPWPLKITGNRYPIIRFCCPAS
jgi:hypothetical protein